MPTWKVYLLRFAAGATIAVGVVGLLFDITAIVRVQFGTGMHRTGIYFVRVFPFVCAVAVAWFTSCLVAGIYLLRRDVRGYRLAWSIAIFQIVYSIAVTPLIAMLFADRAIPVLDDAFLAFEKVDNGLSLKCSLILLLLLGVFFRRTDFKGGDGFAGESNAATSEAAKPNQSPGIAYLMRGLGATSIFFGLLGAIFAFVDVAASYQRHDMLSHMGYSFRITLAGAAINVGLVVALVVAGYKLIKLDRKGVISSNFVLSAEILYWFFSTLTPSLSNFTDFGLAPQVLTAYTLIALPLLNWGAKRLDRFQGWRSFSAR